MKREPMRTAEINIFALTEGQFRTLVFYDPANDRYDQRESECGEFDAVL